MTKQEFIEVIASAVKKYAGEFGIVVYSPIIAQACLESAYGTSEKAKHNNFFGLKYRENRVKCHSGYFSDGGSEQNADGTYRPISTDWYKFANLEMGVKGYFEFINISIYSNLKGEKDPYQYLVKIKNNGYATSQNYVNNVYNVIKTWNLTKYDEVSVVNNNVSSLVEVTKLSQHHSGQRTHSIDRITPHCVVGQLSAERTLDIFMNPTRNASCNYVIGNDGKVGLCVEEKNRSWCSSSNANDQRAITIEVASDTTHPYAFTDAAYNKLIDLCIDICKRYNKKKLLWIDNKDKALSYVPAQDEMLLTVHRWFAAKACPGDWLYSRLGKLAEDVTKSLQNNNVNNSNNVTKEVMYYVICGSYSDVLKARARVAELRKAGTNGYQSLLKTSEVNGKTVHRVQVGVYKNKSNALSMQNRLKKDGYDSFILEN